MGLLRIGVMGCANIAWRSMLPAMLECEQLKLVCVASRTAEKANAFATRFDCEALVGYEKLLERDGIDAIYMPLPTGLHHKWVLQALEAEKHLLVEKSFACTYESAKTMVDCARKKNRLILENFLFPNHSQHQWVHDKLKQGVLGEIHLLRSTFGFPPLPPDNFRYNRELGGGALFDAGTYVVKASTLFLGHELTLLGAALQYDEVSGVDMYGDAMFINPQGQIAQISFGFDYHYQCQYELLGTKGKLVVKRAFTPPPGFRPTIQLDQQDLTQIFTLPADNHYVNMLRLFANTVIRQQDFEPHWEALLVQARLMDSVRKEGGR